MATVPVTIYLKIYDRRLCLHRRIRPIATDRQTDRCFIICIFAPYFTAIDVAIYELAEMLAYA